MATTYNDYLNALQQSEYNSRPHDYAPTTLDPYTGVQDMESATAFAYGFHMAGGRINEVKRFRFGYPLASWYETGEETTFECAWGRCVVSTVLDQLRMLMEQLDHDGKLSGLHNLEDYCVEHITIDRRGTALVQFGS